MEIRTDEIEELITDIELMISEHLNETDPVFDEEEEDPVPDYSLALLEQSTIFDSNRIYDYFGIQGPNMQNHTMKRLVKLHTTLYAKYDILILYHSKL